MARMGKGVAPSARLTTTALYVNENGILVHDTWQGYLPPPDLRVIEAPELKRVPEPVVIEQWPPTFLLAEPTGARADPVQMHAQGNAVDRLLVRVGGLALLATVGAWLYLALVKP